MTPERMNLRIAVACGIKPDTTKFNCGIPSYTTDLNAMHEAETFVDKKQLWYEYIKNISKISESIVHVASQFRAEAFCRTVKCEKCGKSIWDCEQTECKGELEKGEK